MITAYTNLHVLLNRANSKPSAYNTKQPTLFCRSTFNKLVEMFILYWCIDLSQIKHFLHSSLPLWWLNFLSLTTVTIPVIIVIFYAVIEFYATEIPFYCIWISLLGQGQKLWVWALSYCYQHDWSHIYLEPYIMKWTTRFKFQKGF